MPLLMGADRAVDAVVEQQDDRLRLVLEGGRQLLAVHLEIAIAGKADDGALGMSDLGGDGRAILAEAGYSAAEIDRLIESGALAGERRGEAA